MRQGLFTIVKNEKLAEGTYRMSLKGDTTAITGPGQFVNIALEGCFLRRPISVCDYGPDSLVLIYKVVGKGTAQMSQLPEGAELDLLTGLGNGYDLEKSGERPLLIGGGAGVPPLYTLAKQLLAQGKHPAVILASTGRKSCFYRRNFKHWGWRSR